MNNGLARQVYNGQGDFLESSQQAFRGGTLGLLLWIAWVQTSQLFFGGFQRAMNDELGQGQNPQGQRQEPHQADQMVFPAQIDRAEPQGPPLEPREVAFDIGCAAIGQDRLGQGELFGWHIGHVQAPAEGATFVLDGLLVALQVELIAHRFLGPGRSILVFADLTASDLPFVAQREQVTDPMLLQDCFGGCLQSLLVIILAFASSARWGQGFQLLLRPRQAAFQASLRPTGQAGGVDQVGIRATDESKLYFSCSD